MKLRIRQDFLRSYPEPYTVLSALRGPDHDSKLCKILKFHVTSRIRAIVLELHQSPPVLDYTTVPMSEDIFIGMMASVSVERVNYRQDQHFLGHLGDALTECHDHPIWGGYGRAVRGFIQEQVYRDMAQQTRRSAQINPTFPTDGDPI